MSSRKRTGVVVTSVATGTSESCNARDVPSTPLAIPIHDDVTDLQVIGCGFRMEMLTIGDEGPEAGSVSTGAGLGSDAIILEWRGRRAVIYGSEMFKAWVATFAPEDIKRMP